MSFFEPVKMASASAIAVVKAACLSESAFLKLGVSNAALAVVFSVVNSLLSTSPTVLDLSRLALEPSLKVTTTLPSSATSTVSAFGLTALTLATIASLSL